jgi:hypothetical protein
MKITCGDYEVFESGILDCPDLSDTKFIISNTPLMVVIVRVTMIDGESSMRLEVLDDSTIAIVCNRPVSMGYGPAKPVKVGFLEGRALYLGFRLNMKDTDTSYQLSYTFYLKDV